MEWAEGRKRHFHLPTLLYLPQGGVFPIIPPWRGIPALQLPFPKEQSQAPEPSAFQPGRKRLLGAFLGGNKSILLSCGNF